MSPQLIIILLYIIATVAIGVWSMKKTKGSDSFHGAGLGVLATVAAGTGEWLGGTSTIGVAQYGFATGLSGSWYTIANGIGIMFLAMFFAKKYRSMEQITVPGLIETFIGGKSPRVVAAVVLTFVMIVVGAAQIIAAGSLGANGLWTFALITLPLALPGVLAGAVLGFAKALGEFGATITFVSNIPGETQTIASAIYTYTQVPGADASAMRLMGVSIVIALGAVVLAEVLNQRMQRRIAVYER